MEQRKWIVLAENAISLLAEELSNKGLNSQQVKESLEQELNCKMDDDLEIIEIN